MTDSEITLRKAKESNLMRTVLLRMASKPNYLRFLESRGSISPMNVFLMIL
jgi:hypothetical protein